MLTHMHLCSHAWCVWEWLWTREKRFELFTHRSSAMHVAFEVRLSLLCVGSWQACIPHHNTVYHIELTVTWGSRYYLVTFTCLTYSRWRLRTMIYVYAYLTTWLRKYGGMSIFHVAYVNPYVHVPYWCKLHWVVAYHACICLHVAHVFLGSNDG
jgi:hypothetical protein